MLSGQFSIRWPLGYISLGNITMSDIAIYPGGDFLGVTKERREIPKRSLNFDLLISS